MNIRQINRKKYMYQTIKKKMYNTVGGKSTEGWPNFQQTHNLFFTKIKYSVLLKADFNGSSNCLSESP